MIPQESDLFDAEREGLGESSSFSAGEKDEPNAIYTCKFPGCDRQYASTDGVRKHCRKSHPDWLREVDAEKAALGCRWAAYCTRQTIEEGAEDPRTTPLGSKRAREIMAAGNAAYEGAFSSSDLGDSSNAVAKTSHCPSSETVKEAAPKEAFGDRGTLVPPTAAERASSSENVVPPVPVSVPDGSASAPLPPEAKLTPNAQARQRVRALGEIADQEGLPTLGNAGGFFAWGMPPLKRGLSLADTREATVTASGGYDAKDDDSQGPPSRQEAFLDSIIA